MKAEDVLALKDQMRRAFRRYRAYRAAYVSASYAWRRAHFEVYGVDPEPDEEANDPLPAKYVAF